MNNKPLQHNMRHIQTIITRYLGAREHVIWANNNQVSADNVLHTNITPIY